MHCAVVSSVLKRCLTSLIHQIQLCSPPSEKKRSISVQWRTSTPGRIFIISLAVTRWGRTTILKNIWHGAQEPNPSRCEKFGFFPTKSTTEKQQLLNVQDLFLRPHQVTCKGNYSMQHCSASHLDSCIYGQCRALWWETLLQKKRGCSEALRRQHSATLAARERQYGLHSKPTSLLDGLSTP